MCHRCGSPTTAMGQHCCCFHPDVPLVLFVPTDWRHPQVASAESTVRVLMGAWLVVGSLLCWLSPDRPVESQMASMATSDACSARARRSARSPLITVPPGSATAVTRASTADPVCARARSQAALRASARGTVSAMSHVRRNLCWTASLGPSPVRHSMSTTDGTTGGQRPSARKALISAAARPERSASRVTAPESRTNTGVPVSWPAASAERRSAGRWHGREPAPPKTARRPR